MYQSIDWGEHVVTEGDATVPCILNCNTLRYAEAKILAAPTEVIIKKRM